MTESCCAVPQAKATQPHKTLREKVTLYRPLIVIALISVFAGLVMDINYAATFMSGAMGLFLIQLSALKFFDLKGFAATFSNYDPLAARVRAYASIYPFLELAAGVFFLAGVAPVLTNLLVLIVFGINTVGVINVIRSGRDVRCGCAGTGFTLPVGRVTAAENLAMVVMAALNLLALL